MNTYGAAAAWGTTEYTFHIRRMKPSQMDLSISLSKSLFPSIPTKRELKQAYKANNSICKIQYKTIKFLGFNIEKPTGICSVIPMNAAAMKLLEDENLNGLTITPEHIVKERKKHTCIYIGSVGSIGTRAKSHISTFISGLIHTEFEHDTNAIFTRPTTKDGLRAAKSFGFTPVKDDAAIDELDRLYKLYKDDYENS